MFLDNNQFLDSNDKDDNVENNGPILFDDEEEDKYIPPKKKSYEEQKQVVDIQKMRPQTSHQPNNYNFLYDKDDFDEINTDAYKSTEQSYQDKFYSTVQSGQNNAFKLQTQKSVGADANFFQQVEPQRPTTATAFFTSIFYLQKE